MSGENDTPMRCRACKGNFEVAGVFCGWCKNGWMTPEKFGEWMAAQSGLRRAAKVPAATSTLRFEPHRVLTLDRIAKVWDGAPKRRLGELIVESLALQHMRPEQLATLSDERLCELLEYFRMFAGGG